MTLSTAMRRAGVGVLAMTFFVAVRAFVRHREPESVGSTALLTGELFHDFGIVHLHEGGNVAEHVFELRNTASAPIRILSLSSTCGCTDVAADQEVVEPGGIVHIHAALRLSDSGPKSSQIRLVTIGDHLRSLMLSLQAIGRRSRTLTAGRHSIEVLAGSKATLAVYLSDYGSDEEPPALTITPPPGIRVTLKGWKPVEPRRSESGIPALWEGKLIICMESTPDRLGPKWQPMHLTMPDGQGVDVSIRLALEPDKH